jgi:hypothetical protein
VTAVGSIVGPRVDSVGECEGGSVGGSRVGARVGLVVD